jgi:hypothetical protein
MTSTEEPNDTGWTPGKFVVKHYRRGDLLDGEAFVLVPERDPAALVALRAYIQATPDHELAERLGAWADYIDPDGATTQPTIDDKLPTLVATFADAVDTGTLDVTTALFRIATAVRSADELSSVR